MRRGYFAKWAWLAHFFELWPILLEFFVTINSLKIFFAEFMDFRSGRIDVGEERNFGGKLAEVDVEMGPGRSIFPRKISIFRSIHFLAKRCHLQSVKSISVYFF